MELNSAALSNIIRAGLFMQAYGKYPRLRSDSSFAMLSAVEKIDRLRETFYGHDPESLKIFDWISQYRIIQSMYGDEVPVMLPGAPYSYDEWKELERRAEAMTSGFVANDYLLDRIDTWLLEAYSLKGKCEARPGDVVLDCGSYTGNTCLYFSQKAGPAGHVYGFEPVAGIYEKLAANLSGHPNITPVNAAVTRKNGMVPIQEVGFGSCIGESDVMAAGLSIDCFVEERGLERVDFIKMDVEGAEADALAGAAKTIKSYAPRMALSAYHKEQDILDLPLFVSKIDNQYKFALRHFSMVHFETVLYCYME